MTFRWRGRLPHRRVQTLLAVAALGTAVALPVVLLSVGGGVFDHEIGELQASGYQLAVTSSGVHGVDGAHGLVDRIDALPDVAWASPVLSNALELYSDAGATPALAEGILPGAFAATLPSSESGLFPDPLPLGDPSDAAHFANGTYDGPSADRVLVSTPIAAAEHLAVGAVVRLSADSNVSSATPFTVAGTFGIAGENFGTAAVFGLLLPLSDLQVLIGVAHGPRGSIEDAADTIQVALGATEAADPGAVAKVVAAVQAMVPYYSVTTVNDEAAQLASAQAVLTGFYLGLSAIGLIVGLAFLALLLRREVEIERRSIGVRRALGIPDRAIIAGLLRRGYLLAATGAAVGVVLGALVIAGLAAFASGDVAEVARLAVFDPAELAGLGLLVVLFSTGAGWTAARPALRRPIPEMLR